MYWIEWKATGRYFQSEMDVSCQWLTTLVGFSCHLQCWSLKNKWQDAHFNSSPYQQHAYQWSAHYIPPAAEDLHEGKDKKTIMSQGLSAEWCVFEGNNIAEQYKYCEQNDSAPFALTSGRSVVLLHQSSQRKVLLCLGTDSSGRACRHLSQLCWFAKCEWKRLSQRSDAQNFERKMFRSEKLRK